MLYYANKQLKSFETELFSLSFFFFMVNMLHIIYQIFFIIIIPVLIIMLLIIIKNYLPILRTDTPPIISDFGETRISPNVYLEHLHMLTHVIHYFCFVLLLILLHKGTEKFLLQKILSKA